MVRPGYKQTDVGVIPDDWGVAPLGDCLASKPRYGINAPAIPYSDKLQTYVRITDITRDGRFSPEKIASVDSPLAGEYVLRDGDLVFARTGATVGKSYRYRQSDGELVFAGFLIRIRPNPTKLLPQLLAAYVTSERYWNWVRVMSMRSGQPGINGNEYAQLLIPLPVIAEQRAIAAALSDVDELIASLDALIAKKRDIKQAAMQQLLTGKIRLPGFSREWGNQALGALGSFSKGKGIRRDQVQSDGLPCIRYGEIYTHHRDHVREFYSFISPEVAKISQRLKMGDLLFTGSGETAAEIGKCVAFMGDEEAYAGGDIVILSPEGGDPKFLGYLMNHSSVVEQKARMAQGDAVVHISATNLSKVRVSLPDRDEQEALGSVLWGTDAEIGMLETRCAKTIALKQGMIHELLTGRIRLI